jgi:hypothetical protein
MSSPRTSLAGLIIKCSRPYYVRRVRCFAWDSCALINPWERMLHATKCRGACLRSVVLFSVQTSSYRGNITLMLVLASVLYSTLY